MERSLTFDLNTIVLITGFSHFLQVIVFYYQHKVNRNLKGPGWWLLWSATESIAFMLILLRTIPSMVPFIIPVQDPLIFLGTIFIYIGILEFFNNRVNYKIIYIIYTSFVLIHLFFYFIIDSMLFRVLAFDIFISFMGFASAYALYLNRSHSISTMVNFNIVLMLIHASIFGYRSIMLMFGAQLPEVTSTSFFNLIQYFDALIIALLWTFGFIMMLNQKLNSEMTEVKNQFEQIFHLSPDAVLLSRLSDQRLINCNESFTNITGYQKEDLINKTSLDIQLWENPDERNEFFRILSEHGSFHDYEVRFRKKDKGIIDALISANIITLNDVPHVITVSKDITDRKKAEKEVKEKNNELMRLNSEKEKFFSIIAHDLKSPFQGLIGYSEILTTEFDNLSEDEIQNFIHAIDELSHDAFKLLENLLEWTRIQMGKIIFNPEEINLLLGLHPTLSLLKQTAQNKSIKLEYDIDNMIYINADKNMLMTIIRNLVSNAIKFTNPNGIVNIKAEKTDGAVKISVSDSGIGIDQENIKKLFKIDESFSRKGTANEEGTGLGLILCNEMIQKHKGSINVTSEVGKGTTFSLTFPQT